MAFPDNYVEIKDRISSLTALFFQKETSSQQRKEIIAECEQFHEYLSGSLFGTFAHPYVFDLDGLPYTLEYERKYYLSVLKAEYELNLYAGCDDSRKLIKQAKHSYNSPVYIKFLKLVDAIKDGTFDIENCDLTV